MAGRFRSRERVQPCGCDAAGGLLLNQPFDVVLANPQTANERFTFCVAGNGSGEVRVAGESRFAAHRFGEAADEHKPMTGLGEVRADLS